MNKNIYILLTIVGINQILSLKPTGKGYNVELNEKEFEQVLEETKGFGNALTLSDIKNFREKSKSGLTIKECYDKYRNTYENEIGSFNQKIIEFGKKLNSAIKIYYLKQVAAAQQQLTNIAENLKEYPNQLSKALRLIFLAKKKMANKSFEIEKYLKAFYVALLGIHKSGETKASSFQMDIKEIIDQMKLDCQKIVQQIKECLEEDD